MPFRVTRRAEGNVDDRDREYEQIVKDVDKHKPELQKILKIFQSDQYEFGKKIDDYDMDALDTQRLKAA